MKSVIKLLTLSLLLNIEGCANEISSSSTFHHYAKPGAGVDMVQTTEKVAVNEFSDVNITLTTTIPKGSLLLLVSLDKNLIAQNGFEKKLTFPVNSRNESFLIHLKVKSQQTGLYYIRLLAKVAQGEKVKVRSFAIPIYVGNVKEMIRKKSNLQMKAMGNGENISISKAKETIKILK